MSNATEPSETAPERHQFEADVSKLLHMMVHSVYSDRDIFLRELISNSADACERLRFEALASPALLDDDPRLRITVTIDADSRKLIVEDNGIGMSRDEMVDALGTIARSGTKAFLERMEASQGGEGATLIGQFGVGFYSVFMVADNVDVISRRADSEEAWTWSSDGKGAFTVTALPLGHAPERGTRVVLHLMEDAKAYTERYTLERIIKARSGHVPVPITVVEKPGADPVEVADGAALWTKPKSEISAEDYTDFYRRIAGQFDEPALTVHFRAEGRHEFTVLAFIPTTRPFDLFDPERKGRFKLYVKRVLITDETDILPRYLRFVRGLVDSADLPLNVSREMIQDSPILAAIKKSVTGRIVNEFEKLAENDPDAYVKIWKTFGSVLKEGIHEDFERRDALLALSRFKTTAGTSRSLKEYLAALKEDQTAIYYLAGDDVGRLEASPHLEGFRARGIEVLLLGDAVDSFWVMSAPGFEGKPFESVTQGTADLASIPRTDSPEASEASPDTTVEQFLDFVKATLGDAVSDVRASDRLTDSAVCLVAPDVGPDRQLEKILASAGRMEAASKPILEVNLRHHLIASLASLGEDERPFKEDAAHMLLEQARVLEGEHPTDAVEFSRRLDRLIERGLRGQASG